jgi:glycosyltransferase involved in cell wall biosynthesis
MRLLHCIPNFTHGGAERQLSYLAAEMAGAGHQMHLALLAGGPNLARLRGRGIALHHLHYRNNYDLSILWQLIRLIREVQPEIVQTWNIQMDIFGGLATRLNRTPWIIRESSSGPAYPNNWKVLLRRGLVGKADAIVSNSGLGDHYWKKYYPNKKRYVISNGLPLQEIAAAAPLAVEELGLAPFKRIVLFVGRFDQSHYQGGLSHVRNLDNLLLALAQLRGELDLVGVFCGDGPRRPEIRELAGRLGIADRVLLPGFVDNIWAMMKLAEVFVSISHFEGLPNTVLEAMACGCPLVVSDIPAHREFLDESRALMVNRFQPAEIAVAIRRTLENPMEARSRAHRAQQYVQGWSTTAMAQQYEEVYLDILKGRP